MRRRRFLLGFTAWLAAWPAWATDVLVLGLFKDMAVVQIDGNQYTLKAGQSTPQGVKLLSANSNAAVLEVDGRRERFTLGSRVSTGLKAPDLPEARVWPAPNGMYRTSGAINGYPVDFLLDTGATWVAMNAAQARRLGIDFRYQGQERWVSTANGDARVYVVSLDSVKVGDIELHGVDAAVLEGDSPPTVLLGMSFLSRLDMQHQGDVLVLKQKW